MRKPTSLACLACLLGVAQSASAQYIDGALRLSLDGNLFTSRSTTFEAEIPGDPGLGIEPQDVSWDITSSGFGILQPGFGVGIGFGAS